MEKECTKKGKQISELFPPKQLKLDVKSLSHEDLIQRHNILEIPFSLSMNLLQEKRSEVERTCQNIVNFYYRKLGKSIY